MAQKKRAIRDRISVVSGGGTVETVKSNTPDHGKAWCLQRVAAENETSNSTEVRFYIEGHGYSEYLDELDNPLAAHLVTLDREVWLYEGERLVAAWKGTSSGDKLFLYYRGYEMEVERG